jgi:hypothetical protein
MRLASGKAPFVAELVSFARLQAMSTSLQLRVSRGNLFHVPDGRETAEHGGS